MQLINVYTYIKKVSISFLILRLILSTELSVENSSQYSIRIEKEDFSSDYKTTVKDGSFTSDDGEESKEILS